MRARFVLPWLLLGWLGASLVGASLAQAQDRPDADIAALGRTVQADELLSHLAWLSGETGVDTSSGPQRILSRHVRHPGNALAAEELEARLAALGLEVRREEFIHPEAPGLECANIVGELPGEEPDGAIWLLGAHYDSTASSDPGYDPATGPAPGADDDGSGCAAVLEAARVLRAGRYAHTLRFVFFSAEEQGLYGSAQHARVARAAGEDVRLAFCLDPVGNSPGPLEDHLYFFHDQASAELAAALADAADRYRIDYPLRTLLGSELDLYSDHYSFWAWGYPALHGSSLPGEGYHTAADTLERLDGPYMAEATRAVVVFLAEQAGYLGPRVDLTTAGAGCACGTASPISMWMGLGLVAALWLSRRRCGEGTTRRRSRRRPG